MAKEKYCPVNNHPLSDGMCMKNQCAWWIEKMGGLSIDNCSIKALAVSQLHISGCLKIKK